MGRVPNLTGACPTVEPNDLIMRPLTGPGELGLFNRLPYVLNGELADDLAHRRRQPAWMWVALRGDRLLARAAWWTRPGGTTPDLLDVLDVDGGLPGPARLDIGVHLVRTALAATLPAGSRPPQFSRFVPPGWRDSAADRDVVQDRMTILEQTGARLFVERLRLEWRPGTPVRAPRGRLVFRPVQDTGELLTLMTTALDGTLDAHSRADLTWLTPRAAATRHYENELARYTSPRDWWRIATRPDGQPVGFVLPARNSYNPIIAYLAVLPGHRGHGYIDDILAEGTRVLRGQDVPRIRATTDVGNVPMARAFQRAGYLNFEREITMTWG
jgi:RimJ/RimL family protein N-acetyltransferase